MVIENSLLPRLRVLSSIDIHPPDIIEVMSGTQVICFANTAKGEHSMLTRFGRIELVYQTSSQDTEIGVFSDWTAHLGLKVLKWH
jgi:hypothetical protein